MYFPSELEKIIGRLPFTINTTGLSGSKVLCFEDMVLKIETESEESNQEQDMMMWLADKLPVPRVLYSKTENGISYLLMSMIDGKMSCDEDFMKKPRALIESLAKGLKMLWSVSIVDCPYDNPLDSKLKFAEYRVLNNLCNTEDAEPETYGSNGFRSPKDLLSWLKRNRPVENVTFTHGDYCLPNIFLQGGEISGFIDLGGSGIADQYQDIALCYRSLKHNFSGKYGGKQYPDADPDRLFDELGIMPDWEKIKYYILLDELF
ncbi:APH(3') family aminoglycoside O-phosphotransferase [Scatolibacter rhodanostii]|uniref:APH(3') family aminoglycoside O-phosphotransferase n=1 Tax=Scatolibacter rhodanostii TaxID=2014781 RepID=UPI0013566F30|nr:APH(3') family aminoglycoside O-phosphotransferase [Scatolibacter rhodanostii]